MWAPFFDMPCERDPGAATAAAAAPSGSSARGLGSPSVAAAAVSGRAAPASGSDKETVLFQPGQIGVKADWGTGLVRAVPEGGQGAKLGVEPGWQLTEIDGEPFSKDLLMKCIGGGKPYSVVFLKSPETAASAARGSGGAPQPPPPQRSAPDLGGALRPGAVRVGVCSDGLEVSGLRVRGRGRCLATAPIVQDRAYWEVHAAEVEAGLGSRLLVGVSAELPPRSDQLGEELGANSRSYGVQFGAGGAAALQPGDVIGVSYDQSLFPVGVAVWHNGTQVPVPVPRGLKGEQWPALYLSGCTVDWALGEEHWKQANCCPGGFSEVMPSRGLIGD